MLTELQFYLLFYEREIWFFTLREQRRLRALENRVLKSTLCPKRDYVTKE